MSRRFASFLRARRVELGLTQQDLAARVNVSRAAVGEWERGMNYPSPRLVPLLATVLQTNAKRIVSFLPAATASR
jgi:transcriptional regulator with XRE-family HTH domain